MTDFIDSWTQQSGSPIITVTNNGNGTVRLSQISSLALKSYKESSSSRNPDSHENLINSTDSLTMEKNSPHIVSSSSASSTSSSFNRLVNESSVIWLIPVTYKTSDGFSGLIWLTKSTQEYQLCDNCSWIVFNVNKKGYYVVNYSRDQWLTIIDALSSESESFPPQTFTGLLLDVYHLFDLGLIQVDLFFCLMSNVKRYPSLSSHSLALTWSKVSFAAPSFGEGRYLLYQYRRDLLESIYEKVSMISSSSSFKASQEPYAKMIIRYELLEDACEMKVPDCLRDASRYLLAWIHNGTYVPSYLQNVVFRYGMATLNNVTYWELILNNILTGNLNGIKGTALIRGLFAIKDDNLREKAYSLLKDTEYEIEASVLIETKCPTISTKPNPSKSSVLKWLTDTNSYGYPWRSEKSSIPLIQHERHSFSEDGINLLNHQGDPVNPFSYSINLLLLSPSTSMQIKGSLDLNYKLNGTTKYCSLIIGTQLTITTISVYSIALTNNHYQQKKQLIANSFHYRRNNLFIVEFQSLLQPGYYQMHLTYSGNYSSAIIMNNQKSPNDFNQDNESSGRTMENSKSVELKGGFNLFPTFNHSINSLPSFNINLVYRLNADEPLISSSSSSSGSHEGPTIIHSTSTAFINILPSQLRIYLSPDKVRLTRLIDFDNGTELFLAYDNSV